MKLSFKGLFRKKAGGTFFGNLLRTAVPILNLVPYRFRGFDSNSGNQGDDDINEYT